MPQLGRSLGDHAATRQSVHASPSTHDHIHTMAETRKQEKDFTKEVDELIPQATTLAEVSGLFVAQGVHVSRHK